MFGCKVCLTGQRSSDENEITSQSKKTMNYKTGYLVLFSGGPKLY